MKFDAQALQSGAQQLGLALDAGQVQAFATYFRLLQEWNEKLNLTSVAPEDTIALHFLDSLTVAPAITPSGRVIDIGTGAGFPGMALKIAYPRLELAVLDSIAKKLGFIEALSKELGVTLEILCGRAEVFAHDVRYREQFDYVVSRAVADLEPLSQWTLPFLKIGGRAVAMKSRTSEGEMLSAQKQIRDLGGSEARVVEVLIPASNVVRKLIIVDKVHATPATLPKRGNVKLKKRK